MGLDLFGLKYDASGAPRLRLKVTQYSSEYDSWRCMKNRCYNPDSDSYKYYGALGVTVCRRWRNSFTNFLKDMGPKLLQII